MSSGNAAAALFLSMLRLGECLGPMQVAYDATKAASDGDLVLRGPRGRRLTPFEFQRGQVHIDVELLARAKIHGEHSPVDQDLVHGQWNSFEA